MTNKDASFLLGAWRPNGADSSNPEFSEALAQAGRDPILKQWFEDQREFDSAIATRLQSLPVPADLRSRILTGARVSRPAPWYTPRRLWAIAAMFLLFAALRLWFSLRSPHPSESQYANSLPSAQISPGSADQWQDEALAALAGLVSGRENFDARSPRVAELEQRLRASGSPVTGDLPAALQRLASLGCKTVNWHGHPISIICFHGPDGQMVHLAMTSRSGLDNPPPGASPVYAIRDGWRTATWTQGDMAFMLVTKAPESQLRTLLAILPW
jgi:hypothetical protein